MGIRPTLRTPAFGSLKWRPISRMASASWRTDLAFSRTANPASENTTPLAERSRRLTPTSCSNFLNWALKVGWETKHASAAAQSGRVGEEPLGIPDREGSC